MTLCHSRHWLVHRMVHFVRALRKHGSSIMCVWDVGQLRSLSLLCPNNILLWSIWTYQVVSSLRRIYCVCDHIFLQVSDPLSTTDSNPVKCEHSLSVKFSFLHYALVTPHRWKTYTALPMRQIVLPLTIKHFRIVVHYGSSSMS